MLAKVKFPSSDIEVTTFNTEVINLIGVSQEIKLSKKWFDLKEILIAIDKNNENYFISLLDIEDKAYSLTYLPPSCVDRIVTMIPSKVKITYN